MATSSSMPPLGSFSALDMIHVHVDGGVARELVETVVKTLDKMGFQSKFTPIIRALAGPQRIEFEETYESHTPGKMREELDYFSTTRLTLEDSSRQKLKDILERLSEEEGIVIEAEQVIGKGGHRINWSDNVSEEISSSSVGFRRAKTLPIEIHYACDIPKESTWLRTEPIKLEELLEICEEVGIRVGGWFLFDDEGSNKWAYRSNMFAEKVVRERVQTQRDELERHLTRLGNERGFSCTVNALVERSLGVWKTPLNRVGKSRTIQELAKWEKEYPNLKKFWVVAPNFLGDIDENFRQAMIENFRRDVEYTYFLHSFADVQRLRHFARSLMDPEDLPFVFDNIKVLVLHRDMLERHPMRDILNGEYFIANPPVLSIDQSGWLSTEGYKLRRSPDRDTVSGRAMLESEIDDIIGKLRPLIEGKIQGLRVPMDTEEGISTLNRAVIYTDLTGSTALQEKMGDDAWRQVLLEYDFIVANEVSKLGGEVIENLGDGYLLIFDQASAALRCARRLQLALVEHNERVTLGKADGFIPPQKIALDFGPVSRVTRAQGFALTGKTLSRCARLIGEARDDQILMLDTFREMVRAADHNWINEKTTCLETKEFKGLEGRYGVWQFHWER